jgi:ABC-type lipoprotein release transport system permease subunit
MDNSDTQFRSLHQHAGTEDAQHHQTFPTLHEVGQFDPVKLPNFGSLGRMALNAYAPPRTKPGDAAARKALSGHNLAPNSNLGGYVAQPPQLLTTLGSVGAFTRSAVFKPIANEGKPISVIRVRVAGVTGPNAVSRERVRTVAQQIHQRTGLDVDIMAGSSPSPQTLHLPAGKHGRPALQLDQNWTKKGVAATILHTLNRKNLMLFELILLVCGLFVANAATAAVRARHTELGVLSCLGWSRPRLFATILTELAAIGFAGGILGGAITWPIATMTGLHPSLTQTALAVPIAVGLAVAAGIAPARRAAKASPAQALRPIARNPRRARRATGILSLAWSNLTRVPGRALLGAVTMAVGVFALTLLLAITLAFRGALVGTLLGHAISVQTQNIDYIAVALIIILAGLAVADVLYLAIRDRAAEFATLRATGWDETALARLVGYEATIIGAAGAITGAAAGLIGAAIFAGSLPPTLIGAAIAAAIIGTLVTIAAAILPASQLRRLPTTSVLAEE